LSLDGWLPNRISTGVLTRAFPPEAVDAAVEAAGVREQWRGLLQPDTRRTITWKADSPAGLMEAWVNFTRWLIKVLHSHGPPARAG
jgi:hypothetical protein